MKTRLMLLSVLALAGCSDFDRNEERKEQMRMECDRFLFLARSPGDSLLVRSIIPPSGEDWRCYRHLGNNR